MEVFPGTEALVQAALFSMDLKDGAVKAMIGGRDFNESQFNRAIQSRRQPGSSFKPIVYTAAMESGFTPDSVIIDAPIVHDDLGSRRRWKPLNFDHKFHGPTDLYTALVQSRNVVAVKLINKVGIEKTIEYARKMGITSPLYPSQALALGSTGVSLAEMVGAFSTFPNLGERVEPLYITRIEDRDGNILEEFMPVRVRAIEPATAGVMLSLLQGVVKHGTGTRVRALKRPCGGKTGTSNDLVDTCFIGFTPEYVTGAWVGLDELKRMGYGESGGRSAAPIFLYYMKAVLADKPVRDFDKPEGVEYVNRGSNKVCFLKGTIGKGISEVGGGTAGGEFMKSEWDEKEL